MPLERDHISDHNGQDSKNPKQARNKITVALAHPERDKKLRALKIAIPTLIALIATTIAFALSRDREDQNVQELLRRTVNPNPTTTLTIEPTQEHSSTETPELAVYTHPIYYLTQEPPPSNYYEPGSKYAINLGRLIMIVAKELFIELDDEVEYRDIEQIADEIAQKIVAKIEQILNNQSQETEKVEIIGVKIYIYDTEKDDTKDSSKIVAVEIETPEGFITIMYRVVAAENPSRSDSHVDLYGIYYQPLIR